LTTLGLPLLLAACGGADSSDKNSAAEGAWTGTDSWGNSFSLLVLVNGDYYSLYGANKPECFQLQGFDQGAPTLDGDTLKGVLTEYDNTNKPAKGTLDATLVAGSTIKGSITNAAGTSSGTFSATPLSAKYPGYDYNATAYTSNVQSSWTVTSLNSNSEKVTINDKGVVTGSIKGCSFSGTVTPRSTGKNVLNMGLLFGPSPCELANKGLSGIAMDYDLGDGKRQLHVALQDPIKAHGYSFSAQR
jgi:hypothetical protein